MGKKLVEALRANGMSVEAHHEHFPEGTSDAEWLTKAGTEGWVVLTRDTAIRYNVAERQAVLRAGVAQFVLVGGNLSAGQMTTALLLARTEMEQFVRQNAPPFIARVGKSGALTGTVYRKE